MLLVLAVSPGKKEAPFRCTNLGGLKIPSRTVRTEDVSGEKCGNFDILRKIRADFFCTLPLLVIIITSSYLLLLTS